MKIGLRLCSHRVALDIQEDSLVAAICAYYAPCIQELDDDAEAEAEIRVTSETAQLVRGPNIVERDDIGVLSQLEWSLLQVLARLSRGFPLLHAGCVVLRGTPIILLADSGGGKSAMTRAFLQLGGDYVSDDLLVLRDGLMSGLARSVRFKAHDLSEPLPNYLLDCDISTVQAVRGERLMATPLWWTGSPVRDSVALHQSTAVVVAVGRGPDVVARSSSLERNVWLHESSLASTRLEYDGSLGSGPSYRLSWTDPLNAARLLLRELGMSSGA